MAEGKGTATSGGQAQGKRGGGIPVFRKRIKKGAARQWGGIGAGAVEQQPDHTTLQSEGEIKSETKRQRNTPAEGGRTGTPEQARAWT